MRGAHLLELLQLFSEHAAHAFDIRSNLLLHCVPRLHVGAVDDRLQFVEASLQIFFDRKFGGSDGLLRLFDLAGHLLAHSVADGGSFVRNIAGDLSNRLLKPRDKGLQRRLQFFGICTKLRLFMADFVEFRLQFQRNFSLSCMERLRGLVLLLLQHFNFGGELFLCFFGFLLQSRYGIGDERAEVTKGAGFGCVHVNRCSSCDVATVLDFRHGDFAVDGTVGERMDGSDGMGSQGEGEKERKRELLAQHDAGMRCL